MKPKASNKKGAPPKGGRPPALPDSTALVSLTSDRASYEWWKEVYATTIPANELAKAGSALVFNEFVRLRNEGKTYKEAAFLTGEKIGCSDYLVGDIMQRVWKSHAIDLADQFKLYLVRHAPDAAFLKVAALWGFGNGTYARLRKLLTENGADAARAVKLRDTRVNGWRRR